MFGNYEKFKKDIFHLTRIDLNAYKEQQMRRRIESLIVKNKLHDYEAYFQFIKKDKEAFDQFINFLTINVSEFYRNLSQWEYLSKEVFPELIHKFGERLKIWSAACSTGDEPYSVVMCLSKFVPLSKISVLATDIDKGALEKAKLGIYTEKSIANVPEEFKKKYFKKIGNSYQISDEIKKRVTFQQKDLLRDPYPSQCDLIICRNVVIYFTEETKMEIYKKFNQSLKEGGVLFIGSTEQIIQYKELNYNRKQSFFFEKK